MVDFEKFLDAITPGSDKKNRSIQKKLLNLFFPKFSWKTFTFWWGLLWASANLFIVISENFAERLMFVESGLKTDVTKGCRLAMFGSAVTPAIKYLHHYHRLLLGPLICDNVTQILLGLYCMWSYGFLYEKHYSRCSILTVAFGATIVGSLIGSFWEFKLIRAQGTVFNISWTLIYGFLLWDKMKYNIVWFIVKIVMLILKSMAILMGSLTEFGDPIGTLAAAIFSFLLGLSLLKEVAPRTDEERKFILARLKIFLFIISITVLLFAFSFVTVMYDNKKTLKKYQSRYACNVTDASLAPPPPRLV